MRRRGIGADGRQAVGDPQAAVGIAERRRPALAPAVRCDGRLPAGDQAPIVADQPDDRAVDSGVLQDVVVRFVRFPIDDRGEVPKTVEIEPGGRPHPASPIRSTSKSARARSP